MSGDVPARAGVTGIVAGYGVGMTMNTKRGARLALAGVALFALPLVGCADEDNDGANTDEEIQDVRDGVDQAEDEVRQEIDGQNRGSNEDNE